MATAAESTENRIPDGTVSLPRTFIIASRASQLAKIQTYIVRDALEAAHPSEAFGLSFMTTGGDKNQAQALYLLGGKALWTEELEDALLKGEVDIIVHSLKDVPTTLPDRCEIGAILEREDPRDSLVVKAGLNYKTLDDLPEGSIVGTSSVRRVAQLKRAFPKLAFADVVSTLGIHIQHNIKTDTCRFDSVVICENISAYNIFPSSNLTCAPCPRKKYKTRQIRQSGWVVHRAHPGPSGSGAIRNG